MADDFEKLPREEDFPAEEPSPEVPEPEGECGEDDGEDAPKRPGAELFEWLQMIMGCVLAAVLLFNCFARLSQVDGGSMDNTLEHGELMLVWDLGYQPKAGDIVVLNKTVAEFLGGEGGEAIVKRVIATSGQTVDIDYNTGTVYVDGVALDEPYIKETMHLPRDSTMWGTHWEVPEGSIFVMGDNRNASTDSRDERLGTIDTDYVLGKVVLALWPASKFGPL